jgi:hypothetical protein
LVRLGAHYRRDPFRVKDVHVSGEVKIESKLSDTTKGKAMIEANWGFPPINDYVEKNQQLITRSLFGHFFWFL